MLNQLKCPQLEKLCKTFSQYDIEIEKIFINPIKDCFFIIKCHCNANTMAKKHLKIEADKSFTYSFEKLINELLLGCNCKLRKITLQNTGDVIASIHIDYFDSLIFNNPKYADEAIPVVNVNIVNQKDGSIYKCEYEEKKVKKQKDRFELLDL